MIVKANADTLQLMWNSTVYAATSPCIFDWECNAVTAAQGCHLVKDSSRNGKGTASIGGIHNARDAALTRAAGQHQVDLHQKEKFSLFSNHIGSLLRLQRRAITIGRSPKGTDL